MAEKAKYEKPSVAAFAERVESPDYEPDSVKKVGTDAEKSENGFINVDPIYQNFANDTQKPLTGNKGAESKIEKRYLADEVDREAGATPEGEAEAEKKKESEATGGTGASGPTGPSTTPPPSN